MEGEERARSTSRSRSPPRSPAAARSRSRSPSRGRSRSRSGDRRRSPVASRSRSGDRRRASRSPPRRSRSRSRDRRRSRSPPRRSRSRSGDRRRRSRSRSRDRRRRSPSRDRYRSRSRSRGRGGGRRYSPPRYDRRDKSPPPARGSQVFVAGIPFMMTERDVGDRFDRYGRVKDVRIVRNPQTGENKGFGFVEFESEDDAAAAIRALDGSDWNGRRLLVEIAKRPRN